MSEREIIDQVIDDIELKRAAERRRCLWWARARIERGILPLSALIDDIEQGHPIPKHCEEVPWIK